MNAKLIKTLLLAVAALAAPSCRTPQSFEHAHASLIFEVALNGGPKKVSKSEILIELTAMNYQEKKCLFRVTQMELGETTEEWVAVGEYFHSASWLGSRRFKVAQMHDDRALILKSRAL